MKKNSYLFLICVLFFVLVAGLAVKLVWFNKVDKTIDEFALSLKNALEFSLETATSVFVQSKDFPTAETVGSIKSFEEILKFVYTIEKGAYVTEDDLDIKRLLKVNLKTDIKANAKKEPKVLIFHTHSQEAFADSREGEIGDTIVGVGSELAKILVNDYNISVVHDYGTYDFKDGEVHREGSYEKMEPAVKKLLEKYPTVEVAIDVHRDGVLNGEKLVTDINEKPTAQLMFVNGITRYDDNGKPVERPHEANAFLEENFAFSLQMQLKANELYKGLMRKIYIKPYRYSLHLLPKSLLVEVGADTSTVEEAKNAMKPLAEILVSVLSDK